MASKLEDFFIAIGLDTKDAMKGLKELRSAVDNTVNGIAKSFKRLDSAIKMPKITGIVSPIQDPNDKTSPIKPRPVVDNTRNIGKIDPIRDVPRITDIKGAVEASDKRLRSIRAMVAKEKEIISKAAREISSSRLRFIKAMTDKEKEIVSKAALQSSRMREQAFREKNKMDKARKVQLKEEVGKLKEVQKINSARIKQAVAGLTKESEASKKLRAFYMQQEKASAKAVLQQVRLNKALKEQVRSVERSATFRGLPQRDQTKFRQQMQQLVGARDIEGMRDLKANVRDVSREMGAMNRRMVGLTAVQTSLVDSTRNLVRSYASLFALFAGTGAINKVGQDFESLQAALFAVAGDSKAVAEDFSFVREESTRLGLNLGKTAKAFVKLKAAAKGRATEAELKDVFLGVAESATILGLSADDVSGAIRALQQSFSKGKLQAEEFRLQLAERIPFAMRALENATGKTGLELDKMFERGELGTDVVIKLGQELRKLAAPGVQKAINTTRVAQNRMVTELQLAANEIFKSGFGEGIKELFETITEVLKDSKDELRTFGKFFGMIFKALAQGIKLVTPLLRFFIDNLDVFFTFFAGSKIIGMVKGITGITAVIKGLGAAMLALARKVLFPILALEELFALFDPNKIGLFEEAIFGKEGFQPIAKEGSEATKKQSFTEQIGQNVKEIQELGVVGQIFNRELFFAKMGGDLLQGAAQSITNFFDIKSDDPEKVADEVVRKMVTTANPGASQ